jgi:hypothetical protein
LSDTNEQPTRRTCVFCGSTDLDRQHLIADQIGKLFPKEDQRTTAIWRSNVGEGWNAASHPAFGFRQKARITCKACNSRWMNDLENRATRVLKWMMFEDQPRRFLTADEQAALASWSMMAMLVIQTAKMVGGADAIPTEHFAYLREHRRPPDSWRIAIGLRQKDWAWPTWAIGLGANSPSIGPGPFAPPHPLQNINTYQATLCVGHFVAYATASLKDGYLLNLPEFLRPAFVDVFPATKMAYWPREYTILTDTLREHFTRVPPLPPEPVE